MNLSVRAATDADLPALARMNKFLIEDEGSRNPMSLAQLQTRMSGFLHGDWQVRLFSADHTVVGYAVYQLRRDEYVPDKTIVYLRQLYIEREQRSQGLGRLALDVLARDHFPKGSTVEIEVLTSNPRGFQFWSKMGFKSYCTTMHLDDHSDPHIVALIL